MQAEDVYFTQINEAEEHEITQLLHKIDLEQLRLKASSLRKNIHCRVKISNNEKKAAESSLMGGMNYHIRIEFEDGISWLARIRRFNATSPPPELRDHIIESEVSTLLFLEKTNIPAPKMYGYALEGKDNPVGVGYILMECMPGKILDFYSISRAEKQKIMEQLADMFIELHRYRFEKFGSLDIPGSKHVGSLARECFTDFAGSSMRPIGPFQNIQDYYQSSIGLLLDMIHKEEIYTDRPLDTYLIYKFLHDKVDQAYPYEAGKDEFYLKHADDKNHILVDDDLNITAIIDWEWAFTAPEALAFNSPMLIFPISDFFEGKCEIGQDEAQFAECLEEKGASNLANIVRNGRVHHQFAFLCTFDFCLGFEELMSLFEGLRKSMEVDQQYDWEQWRQLALERYREDGRLRDILQRSGTMAPNT
ncbi:hypothetical protein QM012_005752 [Aureobasidium pullulans]|uniref:Aminoglycoside phosphotransferase domain-containing protein n=1 Tax=Aureobasidium pullulans TaxID=5580 RepID=A0ABR0TR48_AURPU